MGGAALLNVWVNRTVLDFQILTLDEPILKPQKTKLLVEEIFQHNAKSKTKLKY